MRALRIPFLLLVLLGVLSAQMEEAPPVLKRRDSTPPPTGKPASEKKSKDDGHSIDVEGVIQHLDAKKAVVQADDGRILTCEIDGATVLTGPDGKLTADDFDPGMRVHLKARLVADDQLRAVRIALNLPSGKPKDGSVATAEGPPDEEGRPVLRHGKPLPKKDGSEEAEPLANASRTASTAPRPEPEPEAAPAPDLPLIEKARSAAATLTAKLPNFVCQQLTTRYERNSRESGWQPKDIVSANLVYFDGVEEYKDVKVNNRGAKGMMDLKGQKSTGEFNSALATVMAKGEFHFIKDTDVRRIPAKLYEFTISQPASEWEIAVGGQKIYPASSGRVWIDRETGRALRLEQQADNIPEAFPFDVVEQTVDYDFVQLGNRKVLLPTEAENLGCQRGSSFCAKNAIAFRNYREFRGEATIDYTK